MKFSVERADHIMLKSFGMRLLGAECFGVWNLNPIQPEWEASEVLKCMNCPKIKTIEDLGQTAQMPNHWEAADQEDAVQSD